MYVCYSYFLLTFFVKKQFNTSVLLFKSLKKVASGFTDVSTYVPTYFFSFYSIWELLYLVFRDWHRNFWDLICFLDFRGDNFLWPQQE